MTEKVMPGWDPKADFNDYDERVKFGKKLCCVDKHRLKPPGGGQTPPE
jgi:hypothetical protein